MAVCAWCGSDWRYCDDCMERLEKAERDRDEARAESQKHYHWYLERQAKWYAESTRADDMEFLVRRAVDDRIDDKWLAEARDALALHKKGGD